MNGILLRVAAASALACIAAPALAATDIGCAIDRLSRAERKRLGQTTFKEMANQTMTPDELKSSTQDEVSVMQKLQACKADHGWTDDVMDQAGQYSALQVAHEAMAAMLSAAGSKPELLDAYLADHPELMAIKGKLDDAEKARLLAGVRATGITLGNSAAEDVVVAYIGIGAMLARIRTAFAAA